MLRKILKATPINRKLHIANGGNLFNGSPLPRTATKNSEIAKYPPINKTNGKSALKCNADKMSPCKSACTPRVIPQPGQFNPVIA